MHLLRRTLSLVFFFFIVFAECQTITELTHQMDSIVNDAIQKQAFPGCVIYASVGDRIIYHNAYGYHTYDSAKKVDVNHLYDLASVTKIVGGTLALMKLYEQGKFNLDDKIGDYIDKLGRRVGNVTFREALAHQAGLYPWIAYHSESRKKDGTFKPKTVASVQNEEFNFKIADSLYLHRQFYQKIKRMIRKTKVSKEKDYRYSGLFFYLIPELVQKLSGRSYEDYLNEEFYFPLKAKSTTFNPTDQFDLDEIVPTEIDTFFRMTKIHGQVHDEGAIMMRGVSGNAGLFSNSRDLASVFEMLLNEGVYDSLSLLKPQTIDLFTTVQYPNNNNRRALGFDKPLLEYDAVKSSVAKQASPLSYGHTGFTGTIAWADPSNDLIFIFLTNRVYPTRNHRALYELNVRPLIHQLFYDYLKGGLWHKTLPVEKAK